MLSSTATKPPWGFPWFEGSKLPIILQPGFAVLPFAEMNLFVYCPPVGFTGTPSLLDIYLFKYVFQGAKN